MITSLSESYDRVLYPGRPFIQTHPDRLATLARIHGLQPADPGSCRVLELGCTDGGNLIPMAYALPGSKFAGIDLNEGAVSKGREKIAALALRNITIDRCDLMDLPSDFGTFDYIIAHGVYSWVPQMVREKLLSICSRHLEPHGVAYISYNTYPGGHLRGIARGLMSYHVQGMANPLEQRQRALELLGRVASAQDEADVYGRVLRAELKSIEERGIAGFHHDDLAECHSAFYFHEFVAAAARFDLQFLSEAFYPDMQGGRFPPDVLDQIVPYGSDRTVREQYLDFLKGRRFRQTLLCKADRAPTEDVRSVRRFHIASNAKPSSSQPKFDDVTEEEFTTPDGGALKTSNGLAKAIMAHLAEVSPMACKFDDLLVAANSLREAAAVPIDDGVHGEFAAALLAMYAAGLVECHSAQPKFTTRLSDRPHASDLVRSDFAAGSTSSTNLLHLDLQVPDPIARELIVLLDGSRDRLQIAAGLAEYCAGHGFRFERDGKVCQSPADITPIISEGLEGNLRKVARMAVLVS